MEIVCRLNFIVIIKVKDVVSVPILISKTAECSKILRKHIIPKNNHFISNNMVTVVFLFGCLICLYKYVLYQPLYEKDIDITRNKLYISCTGLFYKLLKKM